MDRTKFRRNKKKKKIRKIENRTFVLEDEASDLSSLRVVSHTNTRIQFEITCSLHSYFC